MKISKIKISTLLTLALLLSGLSLSMPSVAKDYYVRSDGGSAQQCNGLSNKSLAEKGENNGCAWNHPFQALPPEGKPKISAGDTLYIGNGSYQMGHGAPGAGSCSSDYPWDCFMPAIPSGKDKLHPTRIVGEMTGKQCVNPPVLWGAERSSRIINLKGASNVEISCLNITDRDNCIEFYNPEKFPCEGCVKACQRDKFPYGNWADTGLYAEDSDNVVLNNLRIHGMASQGIHAGRISNWQINNTQIVANGMVGWDGDLAGPSSNSGTIVFRNTEIAWNGCSEDWKTGQPLPKSCWGQESGGYGDGIGLANSGGTWRFEDVVVHHNSSDGIDLLYLDKTAKVEVSGLKAYANAGNQLKISGSAEIENSVLNSNCSSFKAPLMREGDLCRAQGNTLSISLFSNSKVSLKHSTLTGEGDCLMIASCKDESCNGSEKIQIDSSIFVGHKDWRAGDQTCLYWYGDGLVQDPFSMKYSLINDVKDLNACPGEEMQCDKKPGLVNDSLENFDGHLLPNSRAINSGNPASSTNRDVDGNERKNIPDIGAYESL